MKKIVYTRADGGLSVVVPTPGFISKFPTETEAIAALQAKDVPPDASDISVVDEVNLPNSREFRNAWEQAAPGSVTINMPKARTIHAARISKALANEIARLQVEEREERILGNTTKADEHNQTRVALEALDLNALATQIQNAATPQALSAIWPAQLPRKT